MEWSPPDLALLDRAMELEVAVPLRDGRRGRWIPIWVVVADGAVFVRTWHRRETGWYGAARRTGRAWIGVPGLECAVLVRDADERDAVDAAYRRKYGEAGAGSMTTEEAAHSTLRLDRAGPDRPGPTLDRARPDSSMDRATAF